MPYTKVTEVFRPEFWKYFMNRRSALFFCIVFFAVTAFTSDKNSFEENQKGYDRVQSAYARKEELFFMKCRSKNIPESFGNIYLRAFKKEGILELWVQNESSKWVKFSDYEIYAQSGKLGPKRKQGDCQVPEGFYYINEFNPYSNYHLSLGIDYPNQSDMMLSWAEKKGGDIFIHGGQVSAGCLAMSNYYIEDIYIAAVKAKNQGQSKIPVHIFPFRMSNQNVQFFTHTPEFAEHARFWKNLQQGYNFFENQKSLPRVNIGTDGYYRFTDSESASN